MTIHSDFKKWDPFGLKRADEVLKEIEDEIEKLTGRRPTWDPDEHLCDFLNPINGRCPICGERHDGH